MANFLHAKIIGLGLTQIVVRRIPRDPVDPRNKRGSAAVLFDGQKDDGERLLDDFFGIRMVADPPVNEVIDALEVAVVEFVEVNLVCELYALDQIEVAEF